jgi:precorrin-4 methylase
MAKKFNVLKTTPFKWELTISVYDKKTKEVQLVARYKTGKPVLYERAREMALEKVAVTSVKDKRKEGVCYFVERL